MPHPDAHTTFRYSRDAPPDSYNSISAVYLTAAIALPTGDVLQLDTLSMLSISTHREKFPVSGLGRIGAKAHTRGKRMIAGTLVFSIVDRSAFSVLMDPLQSPTGYTSVEDRIHGAQVRGAFYDMKADELPPFDLHMVYYTPDGILCYEGLRRVDILDEGSVRSMDMLGITESYSFMAIDRIPIKPLSSYTDPPAFVAPTLRKAHMQKALFTAVSGTNTTPSGQLTA